MTQRAMQSIRWMGEGAFGAAIAAVVFAGLSGLISGSAAAPPAKREARKIHFTRLVVESPEADPRPRKPLKPPTVEHEPLRGPAPGPGVGAEGERAAPIVFTSPTLPGGGRPPGIAPRALDGDLTPLVRIPPEYPPNGRGSGSVLVRFDVTKLGTVANARVVESSPAGMFDKAALKAISRCRYRPAVVDGEPAERRGLQVRLRFELEEA
jgi:protein TonB